MDPEYSHFVTLTSISNDSNKIIPGENIKAIVENQSNIRPYKDYM